MGEHELHNALRREADSRIRTLWAEAETEVATRREALKNELAALQQATGEDGHKEVQAVHRSDSARIEQEVRRDRLLARTALAERLLALATQLLAELGAANREGVWRNAVAELPAAAWQTVTVHPDDAQRARRAFPQAEVKTDPALIGGVIAAAANGRIVVDNSLAGRLVRGWPELLPELTGALERELNEHGPAGPAATG